MAGTFAWRRYGGNLVQKPYRWIVTLQSKSEDVVIVIFISFVLLLSSSPPAALHARHRQQIERSALPLSIHCDWRIFTDIMEKIVIGKAEAESVSVSFYGDTPGIDITITSLTFDNIHNTNFQLSTCLPSLFIRIKTSSLDWWYHPPWIIIS